MSENVIRRTQLPQAIPAGNTFEYTISAFKYATHAFRTHGSSPVPNTPTRRANDHRYRESSTVQPTH